MMMGRADIAEGMAAVTKEMSKLDGVPVLQVVRMGAAGMENVQAQQEQQAQQPPQQQAERPSAGGVLGGALGGRLGRFGGLGRKRQEPKQEQAQQQEQTSAPAQPQSQSAPGSLLEMTTEMSDFSSAPVDGAKFEVPAGFKRVESELKR
jgi:hypothetical protein